MADGNAGKPGGIGIVGAGEHGLSVNRLSEKEGKPDDYQGANPDYPERLELDGRTGYPDGSAGAERGQAVGVLSPPEHGAALEHNGKGKGDDYERKNAFVPGAPDYEPVHRKTDTARKDDGAQKSGIEGKVKSSGEKHRKKAPQHDELALSEIYDLGYAVDGVVAYGHHCVNGADREAADQHIEESRYPK